MSNTVVPEWCTMPDMDTGKKMWVVGAGSKDVRIFAEVECNDEPLPPAARPDPKLRVLRLWHWRQLGIERALKNDVQADFHLRMVQALNSVVMTGPGDTADRDNGYQKVQA